jgi:arginyl-tRNA synthetase
LAVPTHEGFPALKAHLQELLCSSIEQLKRGGLLPADVAAPAQVSRSRDPDRGDFASNLAMVLAGRIRQPPRAVAEALVKHLPASPKVARVEVAGPGFINFHLSDAAFQEVVWEVLEAGDGYGRSRLGEGRRVCLEFVSANPTGPLHVGHGRGAAYGAALAALLEAAGYTVHREYYVNDAGRQMDILAVSVWMRYLELCGETLAFPANGYRGDYVYDIAADLHRKFGGYLQRPAEDVLRGLPHDADAGGDKEKYIDALIERAKRLLGEGVRAAGDMSDDQLAAATARRLQGEAPYATVFDRGLEVILDDIRRDLEQFGVRYDRWFSERSLAGSGAVERAIARLRDTAYVYEHEGALWFNASAFGDEKDRVLVRENGQPTYFATDVAYHADKCERGFDHLVNIWGADHHGYVARIKGALQALGHDPSILTVLLVQFAILYRGEQRVQMSTRSGKFVTLRELRREVGGDAARFFYVMRKSDQHLDFDLNLAKSQSADNPVYYVQYAHARIAAVMRQLGERGLAWDRENGRAHMNRLVEFHERGLLRTLSRYPEVIESAAASYEPHQIAHYLRELANDFHAYYNAHTFLVEEAGLRDARLALVAATGQVIRNGLGLLGVTAPESM